MPAGYNTFSVIVYVFSTVVLLLLLFIVSEHIRKPYFNAQQNFLNRCKLYLKLNSYYNERDYFMFQKKFNPIRVVYEFYSRTLRRQIKNRNIIRIRADAIKIKRFGTR